MTALRSRRQSKRYLEANGDSGDDIFILRGGEVNIDGGDGRDILSANQRSIFAGLDVDLLAGTIKTFSDREQFLRHCAEC
ncbi:MAG: hypothetical protein MRJ52_03235 [Nitrosomonas sp.]|nr:hypothetical protein [Nitrosomonas sp.]